MYSSRKQKMSILSCTCRLIDIDFGNKPGPKKRTKMEFTYQYPDSETYSQYVSPS